MLIAWHRKISYAKSLRIGLMMAFCLLWAGAIWADGNGHDDGNRSERFRGHHDNFAAFGLWELDQYDFETKTKINTVFTCLNSDGTFKMGLSLPINDWVGNWKRKGDVILMRGKTIDGFNYNAYSLVAHTTRLMTSYGQSWNITDTSSGFYVTAVWTFKSPTC